MKITIDNPNILCLNKSIAFEVGQALRTEIKKNDLTEGFVRQVKRIVEHHSDDTLLDFFQGLIG
jgi:hypothetical protein